MHHRLLIALILVIGIFGSGYVSYLYYLNEGDEIEDLALERLHTASTKIGKAYSEKFILTLALEAFAQSHVHLNAHQRGDEKGTFQLMFDEFVASLELKTPGIMSLQLAPDAIVTHVSNAERNKAAIGHDLLIDDQRREQVLETIERSGIIVAGPVTLIQGGEAFIARRSILTKEKSFDPERYIRMGRATKESAWLKRIPDNFWGLATVLIDSEVFFQDAKVNQQDDRFIYALRGRHGLGADGEIFWGDKSAFDNPLKTEEIDLGGGSWILAISSRTTFASWPGLLFIFFLGVGLSVGAAYAASKIERSRKLAEDANHAKSEFLANMSHEIRTPMNAVIGMTNLALKTDLTEKQRSHISKANQSAKTLLDVLNDILDFSKIEAGKLHLENTEFQFEDAINNAVHLVQFKADEKGVPLSVEIADDVPKKLVGDPLRLSQVLINLQGNAIKFSEKGGKVELKVTLKEETENEVILNFSVQDHGIGMDKMDRDKLFQSFTQADSSTTRKYGGTGLGLGISKDLIKMMGGSIHLESELGVGSTVHFTARFKKQNSVSVENPETAKSEQNKVAESIQQLKGSNILVVEDNEINQELVQELLASSGICAPSAHLGQLELNC